MIVLLLERYHKIKRLLLLYMEFNISDLECIYSLSAIQKITSSSLVITRNWNNLERVQRQFQNCWNFSKDLTKSSKGGPSKCLQSPPYLRKFHIPASPFPAKAKDGPRYKANAMSSFLRIKNYTSSAGEESSCL